MAGCAIALGLVNAFAGYWIAGQWLGIELAERLHVGGDLPDLAVVELPAARHFSAFNAEVNDQEE
jgi:hypothetical protein